MKVLVTGATGHVGSHVLPELLRVGHEVVPLLMPGDDPGPVETLGLAPATGDVRDGAAVSAAMAGCDAVVHMAAVFDLRASDPDTIVAPAVDGIRHVLEAASRHGVSRVVHLSSIVACGYSDQPVQRDERAWNDDPRNLYNVAKTRSERTAWELSAALDVPLVVLCPAAVLGPGFRRATPTVTYLLDLAEGRALTGSGGSNYVHVADLAGVIARALDEGEPGERYVVAGHDLHFHALGRLVGEVTGRPPWHLPLPRPAMLGLVTALEHGFRLVGRDPMFTRSEVGELAGRWGFFHGEKARRAFGYTPRGPQEMVGDTLEWAGTEDLLSPDLAERVRRHASRSARPTPR